VRTIDAGVKRYEFPGKFSGRLHALAEAHTLLLDSDWRNIDLKALLQQALSAYCVDDAHRAQIEGASIDVTPKQALGLRLIMHELATNAVKHGALSTSTKGGTVYLSWQTEQPGDHGRRTRLRWEERGGPAIEMPRRSGFGARLIKSTCEYDLEGEARLDYATGGLICEIVFPIA
jgi:two-component sensor histidine kinase